MLEKIEKWIKSVFKSKNASANEEKENKVS